MSHYLVECSIGVHCVQLYAALLTPLLWFRSNANAAQLIFCGMTHSEKS